jgi:hypothetical protein
VAPNGNPGIMTVETLSAQILALGNLIKVSRKITNLDVPKVGDTVDMLMTDSYGGRNRYVIPNPTVLLIQLAGPVVSDSRQAAATGER